MNNFPIFIVGILVTLVAGMGVITSQVFLGYKKPKKSLELLITEGESLANIKVSSSKRKIPIGPPPALQEK